MRYVLLLLLGIASEVMASSMLKASRGLTRFWPVVAVLVGYLLSFLLLAIVLKRLPIGPVYASWAGLGTAGTAIIGLTAFHERVRLGGWVGIGFVITGVVLLGLFSSAND